MNATLEFWTARLRESYEKRGGDWGKLEKALDQAKELVLLHQNVLFFAAGFIFDAITLDRIDAWLDLGSQIAYLAGLTALIVLQQREAHGRWKAQGRMEFFWRYNQDALHFLFGGLLSAYFIFYTKSGVNSRSFIFFAAVLGLLIYNEMPGARSWGLRLRVALHAFCTASFLIYLVPVIAGKMGDRIFAVSMASAVLIVGVMVGGLAWTEKDRGKAVKTMGVPAVALLAGLTAFYYLRWIPPVPLSLKFVGIYHEVERRGDRYNLRYERRPWGFLRSQDRPYYSRRGDRLYCFVRIFAPRRFSHEITLHWMSRAPKTGDWATVDRIPLAIRGGRGGGYRGYSFKEHFAAGRWKVRVETEDGRVIGETDFKVVQDGGKNKRIWKTRRM